MAVWSEVCFRDLPLDLRIDAEYFRPEYLAQAQAVAGMPHKRLAEIATISDGNHLSISEEFCGDGVRYLRGQDLSDFFISDSAPIFIPQAAYNALARSHMFPGDILLGIVGTIGSVGLVFDRYEKLTGSCKLAIVRCRNLEPEFVAAYFASPAGQREIARRIRGTVQTGLILPDLREIPVPVFTQPKREAISDLVRRSYLRREESKGLYCDAENLLLKELGLADLDLSPQPFYERRYSETIAAHRLDAEYFQPPKWRVLKRLAALGGRPLSELFRSVRKLFQPAPSSTGQQVRNFDVTDALDPFLDDSKEVVAPDDFESTKKRFSPGDVVVSRLRSYLKEIALVRTSPDIPCVGSTEFIVLRPQRGGLSPQTLLVYLRSPLVQTVLRWCQDGSNHPRFDEKELLRLPVSEKLVSVSKQIDPLIDKSFKARQESKRLLADAKRIVEDMILAAGAEGDSPASD